MPRTVPLEANGIRANECSLGDQNEVSKVIVDVFFGVDMILSAGLKHAPAYSRSAKGFGLGA